MNRTASSARIVFLLGTALLLICAVPVHGQQSVGNIHGTVTDSTGAVVVGAQVTLLNAQTGLSRTAQTNGAGQYNFFGLPIGTYGLTFSKAGFKSEVHSDIPINAGATTTLGVTLQPGSTETSVTVTATPLLNRADTTNGYVLSAQAIQAIPLGTGSFTQLATLSPGVNADLLQGSGTNAGLGNQAIWANGQRNTSNSFSFNGVNANNLFNGKSSSEVGEARFTFNTGELFLPGGQIATNTSVYDAIGQGLPTPPPETIDEMTVNTSMYDASEGANSGAHVAVVTKSGTNEYHGEGYWYAQSNAFNAAPFFFNADPAIPQSQKVPKLQRNVVGGTLGGPLVKNKLLFFVSYQGVRDTDQLNGTSYATVPLNLTNDRSASTLESQFGVTSINPVALKLLQTKTNGGYLIPTPSITDPTLASTLGYDAIVTAQPKFTANQVNANLDYNAGSTDQLALKYYYQSDPTLSPFAVSAILGFPRQLQAGSDVFSLENTKIVSPTVTWQQKLGFIREIAYSQIQQQYAPGDFGMNLFGATLFPGIDIRNADPTIGNTLQFGSAGNFTNGGVFQNQYTYNSNADWVHGDHTFEAGFNFDRSQLNIVNQSNEAAQITINGFTNFLQGNVRTQLLQGSTNRYYRANQSGAYAQDRWQAARNLTVDYGIRWDYDGPLAEEHGLLTNFDPSRYQYNAATDTVVNDGLIVAGNNPQYATPGVSASTLRGRQYGIAPRIGLAWSPSFSKNIVVRAGYGMYYDRGEFFTEFSPGAGYGISGPLGVTQELPFVVPFHSPKGATLSDPLGPTAPAVQTGNPALFAQTIPNLTATAGCPAGEMPNPLGCGAGNAAPDTADGGAVGAQIGGYGINNTLPYSENWMLDVQWQPTNTLALTLGYTGNHGLHELLPIPINQPRIATAAHPVNGQIYSYGFNPCNVSDPNCNQYGNTGAGLLTEPYSNYNSSFDGGNVDLRVPYIGYSPNMAIWQAEGISHYNALEFNVKKRLSHGLQLGGSYTWSHSLDEGSGLGLFYNGNDPTNTRTAYGTSGFDRTHVFALSYLYELPKATANDSSLLGEVLNGWNFSGVTVLESGLPYSVWDYSGGAASIYYSSNDVITNPLIPLAAGQSATSAQQTQNGLPGLNPNAFAPPLLAPGQSGVPGCGATADGYTTCDTVESGYGAAGRNNFRSPFQSRFDVSLNKSFSVTEKVKLNYRLDAFNLFNTPSFDAPNNNSQLNANYSDFPLNAAGTAAGFAQVPGFGVIQNTIGSPRFLQMSLHFIF
jgi:hypothetical protein